MLAFLLLQLQYPLLQRLVCLQLQRLCLMLLPHFLFLQLQCLQ
jgi:hypothetical protein